MTNWTEHTIYEKEIKSNCIRFYISGWIDYRGVKWGVINFTKSLPFAEWEEHDKIKIDNDKTGSKIHTDCVFSFSDGVAYLTSSHWKDKYWEAIREKNNLETERNEWRTKFNDKNSDYEDYKEKYENALKEIDRLKNERINENRRNNDEIVRKERESSTLRVEKTRAEEQRDSANNQVTDLSRRLENKEEELSVVRREKENQEIALISRIDQKQWLLEDVRQSLVDLRVENEREKAEKDIEINEKNSQLREKETKLKRKDEEIKKIRNQKGLSQEELLNEKLSSEKSNLELLANELKINLERVHSLTKYHERLFVAQKGHNQANIDIHEANISRVKQELTDQRVSVVHIQEICRKCKKIAELCWELEQSQQQFQAQQEAPTNNNF